MRDIMLVNPSGLDGHSMAIDMNIEHLIGFLKVSFALYSSSTIYSTSSQLKETIFFEGSVWYMGPTSEHLGFSQLPSTHQETGGKKSRIWISELNTQNSGH